MSFSAFLRNTIGFSTTARVDAIRLHGLESFDSLAELDVDEVKTLIHAARRGETPMIISAIVEKRCKLACYGARIYSMIGRNITGASLSVRRLKQFEMHKSRRPQGPN